MSKHIHIGYWQSTRDHEQGVEETISIGYDKDTKNHEYQTLTYPVENSATEDQSTIIETLKHVMNNGFMTGYRGWSNCRLCGKCNGSHELEIIYGDTKYSIPEGYVHYLEDHNVAIDPKLLEALSCVDD